MIVVLNLSLTFGSTYWHASKSLANSLWLIIHKLTDKSSAQIKRLNSIFDVSSFINKMIRVIFYILPSLHTTTRYTLLPKLHLSLPTPETTLNGVSWIFPRYHETLVQRITSTDYNKSSSSYLHILHKALAHLRPMQIVIVLSLLSRLVTEYGCFVITSRLPDHVLSSIISTLRSFCHHNVV